MGHRALVAYRRPDQRYDIRYSHWGGERVALGEQITAETPLADGSIDPELVGHAISRDRILSAYLDPCTYERLVLVSPGEDYRTTTYRVCWLEWAVSHGGCRGGIVPVDTLAVDERVRIWFQATKTTLADIVEMGALSRRAARTYLEARVCEEEDGTAYTYGEGGVDGGEYATPPDRRPEVRTRLADRDDDCERW